MDYSKFNNQKKNNDIPVNLLHQTDYNNYADLGHFVDEYYKAQDLISQCNNFYKSFLLSKLLPYSKIVSNQFALDNYKFFTYKFETSYYSNGIIDLNKKYSDFLKNFRYYPNPKNITGCTYYAASTATFKLKMLLDKDKSKKYNIFYRNLGDENNCKYVPEGIYSKEDPHIMISMYGELTNVYRNPFESDRIFDKRKEKYQKDIEVYLGFSSDDTKKIKEIREELETEWRTLFAKELYAVIKENSANLMQVIIDNNVKKNASSCLELFKNKNTKKYKDFYTSFKNIHGFDKINIDPMHFISNDELKQICEKYVKNEGFGCWGYGPIRELSICILEKSKFEKTINQILSVPNAKYSKIILQCENDISIKKLYIIDEKGIGHYFCNDTDINNVNITLKDRNLYCTYDVICKYQKWRWPSNSPYTVEETHKCIIFDVDTNEVKSYKENFCSHEESYRDYKYA